MHGCEVERVYCLVVFGAGPGQRSSKHWMSSSELSESQAVITPRSPTHSRQLTTPVTLEWCVCVHVRVCHTEKREDWKGERKLKTRSICACSKYASCVTAKSECTDKHAVIVWVQWVSESCECVCCGAKRRVYFFLPSFFLPLSMSVLYPTPLFSIFTRSSRCEGSEILNYRNGLVSALWLHQKQPRLCSLLTWRTLSHTLIIIAETRTIGERSKSILGTYWLQVCWSSAVWLCVWNPHTPWTRVE